MNNTPNEERRAEILRFRTTSGSIYELEVLSEDFPGGGTAFLTRLAEHPMISGKTWEPTFETVDRQEIFRWNPDIRPGNIFWATALKDFSVRTTPIALIFEPSELDIQNHQLQKG